MELAHCVSGSEKVQQVAALRASIAKLSPQAGSARLAAAHSADPVRSPSVAAAGDRPLLSLPEALTELLPVGGVARGQVVAVSGARSLLVALLASVTAQGARAAVCGCADLGLAAVADHGGSLSRLVVVSVPQGDRGEVSSLLLDGMDLVVLDLSVSRILPARASVIAARARACKAVLVVTGGSWAGADIHLNAVVEGSVGLDRGYGRIQQVRLRVHSQGRTFSPRQVSWSLGSVVNFSERDFLGAESSSPTSAHLPERMPHSVEPMRRRAV